MRFETAESQAKQAELAQRVGNLWSVSMHRFGKMCPLDYWVEKDGQFAGVAELKCREHESQKYPTLFLSLQKYSALRYASLAFGSPALYIAGFTDCDLFIDVLDVNPQRVIIAGRQPRPGSHSDREPIIEVPIEDMGRVYYSPCHFLVRS